MRTFFAIIFGIAVLNVATCQETSADATKYAKLGEKVRLPCSARPEGGFLTMSWMRNSLVIAIMTPGGDSTAFHNYKGRAQIETSTFDLLVDNVTASDEEVFKCDVFTLDDSDSSTVKLTIYATPRVSVQTNALILSPGESSGDQVLAVCNAEGATNPFSMKWIDPMTDTEVASDSSRIDTAEEGSTLSNAALNLVIDGEPADYNGKVFSCVVTDTAGDDTVRDAMLSLSTEPSFTSFPEDVLSVEVGNTELVECSATGVPIPMVSWYLRSQKLSQGVGKALLSISGSSIDDPTRKYTCAISNKAGKARKSVSVYTLGMPIVLPNNDDGVKTETIEVDVDQEIVSLSCKASAKPIPDFFWEIKNGDNATESIPETNKTVEGNFATSYLDLEVEKYLKTKKKVICTAQNDMGSDAQEWIIMPSDSPDEETHKGGRGWIAGVVIAVLFAVLLVALICFMRQNRRKSAEESAETGLCGNLCKRRRQKFNIQGQENDQIKEVCEDEGTKEEKQQLTAAEEQPGEKEDVEEVQEAAAKGDQVEENNEDNATNQETHPEEGKKKRRLKIQFLPSKCCRGSKKQLKEDESVEDEDGPKDDPENDKDEQKVKENADADSGKGDTLEKVIDEPEK